MSIARLRSIVEFSVSTLFRQIAGGRIRCESEATLQLHLSRIISNIGDLELINERETFSIELEKPLADQNGARGRIDIWFRLMEGNGTEWRCAIELKFFKRENHRDPNNRYDVFKDISRLERCRDVAEVGFMIVATDHLHYKSQAEYSVDTRDFDFRHGRSYVAGTTLTYHTGAYGPPITLGQNLSFLWAEGTAALHYVVTQVNPLIPAVQVALEPPI